MALHPLLAVGTLAVIALALGIAGAASRLFGVSFALGAFFAGVVIGESDQSHLIVSASLSQIGELSFVVAGLGTSLGLLPAEGGNLILAGALVSITLNAAMFASVDRIMRWREPRSDGGVDEGLSLSA